MTQYRMTASMEADGFLWYGILAQCGNKITAYADSLTRDGYAVGELAQRMNCGHASLLHFMDVIDDFLTESGL